MLQIRAGFWGEKIYPLLRTSQCWMLGNGWMGWRKGVDAHRAAGRQGLGSKGSGKISSSLESRQREVREGREGDGHPRRVPLPVLQSDKPHCSQMAPLAVPKHLCHTAELCWLWICFCPSSSSQSALYPLRQLGMMDLDDI